MAFPQVAATNSWFETTNVTSHTINLPSWISAWNLLIVLFVNDWWGADRPTFPMWRDVIFQAQSSVDAALVAYYRVADWSEWASITATTPSWENSSHYSYRITGANTTISLNTTWIAYWTADSWWANATTANPPNLAPARWADDNLWIACCSSENLQTSWTSIPWSYAWWFIRSQAVASTAWAYLWYWYRELNASSEDPWVFNYNISAPRTAATIAIEPWSAVASNWNFFMFM